MCSLFRLQNPIKRDEFDLHRKDFQNQYDNKTRSTTTNIILKRKKIIYERYIIVIPSTCLLRALEYCNKYYITVKLPGREFVTTIQLCACECVYVYCIILYRYGIGMGALLKHYRRDNISESRGLAGKHVSTVNTHSSPHGYNI